MSHLNPYLVGLGLLLCGLVLWGLTRLILHYLSQQRIPDEAADNLPTGELEVHEDGILIIQPGGRLAYINAAGRRLFSFGENDLPDLERLARQLRPADRFYSLCASEGHADLMLSGQMVEVTSYALPTAGEIHQMLSIRPVERALLGGEKRDIPAEMLQTVLQLTEAMASNLDLSTTLLATLESAGKLVPADVLEITLWDAEAEQLVPYRLVGEADGARQVEMALERYSLTDGYSGYLASQRKPLLIPDVQARTDIQQTLDRQAFPLHAYLGVPLMVGNELVGTLEMGSLTREAFQEEDLNLLHLISGQAAIALHNARLYQQELRRAAELASLAEVAQAFGGVRDPRGLFGRLVENIATLIPVEIIGFLLYNDNTRMLEGQVPFHGLPPQIVEMYRVAVPVNSPVEKIVLSKEMISSSSAKDDPQWQIVGMDYIAQAASMRETVMVPVSSGGRILGYLIASNHTNDTSVFSKDELHLLNIVANQAAPVIENANLVTQARQRAQRSEALRRITSLSSSAATLNEILQYALVELVRLLQADSAVVFLLDEQRTCLRLNRESAYGGLNSVPEKTMQLKVEDPQFPFSITGGLHNLCCGNLISEKGIIPFYQPYLNESKLLSAVAVPLIVRSEGIGELWIGSQHPDFFDQGDLQVVATAAGQLAGVVERAFLAAQTDDSLRRRVDQLTALTRITRELSTSLDLKYLLQLVYDEAVRTTRADCGTIQLFNFEAPEGEPLKTRFFIGEEPNSSLSSLEEQIIEDRESLNVLDVSFAQVVLPHDDICSMLLVPIFYQDRAVGLITLHANTTRRFDDYALETAQTLAAQAAVAFGNAIQYEEQLRHGALLKRELETISELFQVSKVLRPDLQLDQALNAIAVAIQQATPFQMVLVSVYEPETTKLQRVVGRGISQVAWDELRSHSQPWTAIERLLQSEFRQNQSYFIPADKLPVVPSEVHTVTVMPSMHPVSADLWDPDDMLLVPLLSADGVPLGLISVDGPSDGRRPDRPTLEALELFASQAALVIENQKNMAHLRGQFSSVKGGTGPLSERQVVQAVDFRRLQRQLDQMRTGLEIAEQAGRHAGQPDVLHRVAQDLLDRYRMQFALVGETGPAGPKLTLVLGNLPPNVVPEALFGQRNPLRVLLQDGLMITSADLQADTEWQNCSLLNALNAGSFIGLPFTISAENRAGILVIGQQPIETFVDEDRQMLESLAQQITVNLQNTALLAETRRRLNEVNLLLDFTRKLGSLDSLSILNTLLDSVMKVIHTADAGWVALWEPKGQQLRIQAAAGYAIPECLIGTRFSSQISPEALSLRVFESGQTERLAEVQFGKVYPLPADDLMNYRKATGGKLPVSSLVVPISLGGKALGVLMVENFDASEAFNADDETLTLSLTQQTALALENARLFHSAEERSSQLQALTQVSGTITSSLQTGQLVASLLGQLRAVVPFETATLWLRQGPYLTIAAAAGFEDNESRIGLTVAEEDSALFRQMVKTGQAISVSDVRSDDRFTTRLLEPENYSWLGIPLIAKSELTGVIALEKREASYYTADHVQLAMTFAGQAAVALENARLFEESTHRAAELDQRSQRLALLNTFSHEVGASLDADYILRLTALQLLNAFNSTRASIVMIDEQDCYLLYSEVPETGATLPAPLPAVPLLDRLKESLGIFTTTDVANEPELEPLFETYLKTYNISSLVIVPLVTVSHLQGWLLLQSEDAIRLSPQEIELARTLTNQAAIAIQNARLLDETRQLTEDLEQRVQARTAELSREHRNSQTLLQIITELSSSLDLSQVLNRTLVVVNESIGAEQSLILLARGSQIYKAGESLAAFGRTGLLDGPQPERELAQWVMRQRSVALIDNIAEDARWDFPPEFRLDYASVAAVPLLLGEDVLGTLLLLHHAPGYFSADQLHLVEAIAKQISIALNNAELFSLIRDQAEHLGSMLRDQQIEASRSRAILEAVADGVVVTDEDNKITLFNASAERILDLDASHLLDRNVDEFSGLFGPQTQIWMQTVRTWSEDTEGVFPGEIYSEQMTLDNGRVVSIHLAPVMWRSDFLGTVSIFRDITHEVQVDRLKTEFVANVSHELRTPLTSIKGYVEVLLMGAAGKLNEQQSRFLQIVQQNTARLQILVNDLLDISRIESGQINLSFQALRLPYLVDEVINDLRRRSQEEDKPIRFECDMPQDLPEVVGDLSRVRQVLSSLLMNGYNYTPANGQVQVRMRREDGHVQVDVQDNGIGIAPKDQVRIFDRFYRGEDPLVLATAGTGLGLAIAKILVEMHHGEIWFQSSGVRGEGATFSFTLPVVQPEE